MRRDGSANLTAPTVAWDAHSRFLHDLLLTARVRTVLDLTRGAALAAVRRAGPNVDLVASPPADLVLADVHLPGVADDRTLTLIREWNGQGHATVLPNGLAASAGSAWQWLLSPEVNRWLTAYQAGGTDDERDYLLAQLDELRDALRGQADRIELLERELLSARDEVARLLPLEVSPKAQLHALRRSVPISVRKRIPRRREGTIAATPRRPRTDPRLARLKSVTLGDLLAARFDPTWVGQDLPAFVATGLADGSPVSAAHARARTADALPGGPVTDDWGTVDLVDGTSRTSGRLGELIDAAAAELVTVDVWDTLIVRDRPADAAKLATARRMLLRPSVHAAHPQFDVFDVMAQRVAVEAAMAAADPAGEYLLREVVARTCERISLPADPHLVDALVDAEVADEIAWTRARPDVAALIEKPNVAIVSDFYMSAAQLREIVVAADPRWESVPVYVSVEEGCSKRLGGGLLDLARRKAGVSASAHLHVGDNVHSDITMQTSAGGRAVQVYPRMVFPAPGEFGADDLDACDAALQRLLDALDRRDPTDDLSRHAGRRTAALAVALVARALEQAWRTGVDRVHYVSREGIFLAKVHDVVEPILRPPGVPVVKGVHLALSRRATFGATLAPPYRFSLQRMWSMYAKQSPKAMLISIGVDPADFNAELAAAGLDPDDVLSDARRDPRLEAFLADPAVEAKFSAHVQGFRTRLRRYIEAESVITDPFIVADIGWRGTIQDNLVRALGISSSFGVYVGLFPFLNAQPPGSNKVGVAFDGNRGEDFGFADPPAVLERPWTPDVPSTIGFTECEGRVVPLFDKESGHVSPGIEAYQQGALEVAGLIAGWMSGFGLTTSALRPQIAQWARQVWEQPGPGLADIWFSSDHDDSFGALNHTGFGKESPGPQWLTGDLYRHVSAGMTASGWPQGYLAWRPVASLIELGNLT
jgi:FMN phosphatase YigB (HAD superfamily)